MLSKRIRMASLIPALAAASALSLTGCGDEATGPGDNPPPPGPPTYENIATFVGTGLNGLSPDGLAPTQTELSLPQDITWGPDGQPYILDWNNHRVRTITGGVIQTVVGTGELGDAPDGPADLCKLNHPTHVSFDPQGRLILSAWHNSKLMRMDMGTGMIATFCGNGNRTFSGDGGPAIDAEVDLPIATAWGPGGEMYFTDEASVRIRMIDATGIVTTFCGDGTRGYSGDGGLAANAQIHLPGGQAAIPVGRICVKGGTLYYADTNNHIIRAIDLSTTIITTVAGTPEQFGYSGDGGPATSALLAGPADMDLDDAGNMYIADTFNNVVRKVDTSGIITTFAGGGPPLTQEELDAINPGDPLPVRDGPVESSLLDRPYGVAVDADQKVYIADTHHNRIRVVY
ncbi:MAG TPA: hypothetical protein VKU85_19845 [bacterium]|nr:hypothetical protein [bacterium]